MATNGEDEVRGSLSPFSRRATARALAYIKPALATMKHFMSVPEARRLTTIEGRDERAVELAADLDENALEQTLTYASAIALARPRLKAAIQLVVREHGLSQREAYAVVYATLEHLDDEASPRQHMLASLDEASVDRGFIGRVLNMTPANLRKAISKGKKKPKS